MTENSDSSGLEDLDPHDAGLAAAVLEVGRHVGPERLSSPRWFALVETAAMLRSQPAFGALLDDATREAAAADPHHLTPIELDDVDGGDDPLGALADFSWPDIAAGAAVVCDLAAVTPADGSVGAVSRRLGAGPVRAAVAARADGSTWCSVRGAGRRDQALGPRLLPDLADALALSIREEPEA